MQTGIFELFDQGKGVMAVAELTGMTLRDTQARWRTWYYDRQEKRIAYLERRNTELEREIMRQLEIIVRLAGVR